MRDLLRAAERRDREHRDATGALSAAVVEARRRGDERARALEESERAATRRAQQLEGRVKGEGDERGGSNLQSSPGGCTHQVSWACRVAVCCTVCFVASLDDQTQLSCSTELGWRPLHDDNRHVAEQK